ARTGWHKWHFRWPVRYGSIGTDNDQEDRMRKILAIAAIAIAATACCGSGLPKDQTGAPKLSAVADSIGCKDLQPIKPTMFASAEGNCTLNGRDVDLVTFASEQLQQNWEQIADEFGPKIKDGPGWAAYQG